MTTLKKKKTRPKKMSESNPTNKQIQVPLKKEEVARKQYQTN